MYEFIDVSFGYVTHECVYNQALADVRSTGAGIKCLYCKGHSTITGQVRLELSRECHGSILTGHKNEVVSVVPLSESGHYPLSALSSTCHNVLALIRSSSPLYGIELTQ